MLTGEDVSAGWVDKAVARVSARLKTAGFDDAMTAALAAEDVLAADETPVNVLDKTPLPAAPDEAGEADPEDKDGKAAAGAPHVLIVTTPDGRLRLMLALASRRKHSVGAGIPAAFTGSGVAGLTSPAARELAAEGVRVVSIAPGLFQTPMLAVFPETTRTRLGQAIPFPARLGRPSEYAELAHHIATNSMLNGVVIRLDGALRMAPR